MDVKVFWRCTTCKKDVSRYKVLKAVHFKAMCPKCLGIQCMEEMRLVDGKRMHLDDYIASKARWCNGSAHLS